MAKSPNLADLAREAGASAMTVSRFLNSSSCVGAGTGRRIAKAIKDLRYRPNQIAKSLQSKRTKNIAVLPGNVSAPAINGIGHISFKHGYNLFICNTEFSPEKERAYLGIPMEKQVDGVMIAPCSDRGYLRALRKASIPFDEEGVLFRHPSSRGWYEAMGEIMRSGERPDGIYVTSWRGCCDTAGTKDCTSRGTFRLPASTPKGAPAPGLRPWLSPGVDSHDRTASEHSKATTYCSAALPHLVVGVFFGHSVARQTVQGG